MLVPASTSAPPLTPYPMPIAGPGGLIVENGVVLLEDCFSCSTGYVCNPSPEECTSCAAVDRIGVCNVGTYANPFRHRARKDVGNATRSLADEAKAEPSQTPSRSQPLNTEGGATAPALERARKAADIKLAGGSSNSGRLEVVVSGQWSTVCDDSFDANDALVACRQLGFSTYASYGDASGGVGSILVDDLACSGSESSIQQCSGRFGGSNCGHSEDVYLTCEGVSALVAAADAALEELLDLLAGTAAPVTDNDVYSDCLPCPVGTYADSIAQRFSCSACPPIDTADAINVPQTTIGVGSIALSQCGK